MSIELQTNGPLLIGPVIRPSSVVTGERVADFRENRERLVELARNYRLRAHSDGWFVDGRGHKSQIWEFGIGKLGLTVTGPKFVNKCLTIGDWLNPKSIGGREANFWCCWTPENLARLEKLVGLQIRKKPQKETHP